MEVSPSKLSSKELQKALASLKEQIGDTQQYLLSLRRHGINWSKDPDYATFFQTSDPRMQQRSLVPLRYPSTMLGRVLIRRIFTQDQKEKLSEAIAQMKGDDLRVVVKIIEEEMPHFIPVQIVSHTFISYFQPSAREIEVDLAMLDDFTLSRLQQFIEAWRSGKSS